MAGFNVHSLEGHLLPDGFNPYMATPLWNSVVSAHSGCCITAVAAIAITWTYRGNFLKTADTAL